MAFIEKKDGEWVLIRGKHMGETLKFMAETHPGYVGWMFDEVTVNMSDDEFNALETIMEEFDIPFDKKERMRKLR